MKHTPWVPKLSRAALVLLCLASLGYLLYFHRLGSLLPGYSAPELQSYSDARNWHTVIANPINLPYSATVWLLIAVLHHGILMTRVTAAACGVIAALLFFAVVRLRYSFFVALLGTILFTTSTGFLHISRLGTGQVLQMGLLALIAAILAYRRQPQHRPSTDYGLVALLALLWYIPGLIWFELFAGVILFKGVRNRLRQITPLHLVGYVAAALIVAAPLLLAGSHHPSLLLSVFGLPTGLHPLTQFGSSLLHAVLAIAIRSDGNPLLWVGHAPLLSVAEFSLGLIGAYVYFWQRRGRSSLLLGGNLVISLVLIGFASGVGYATLIPLLYLFVVAGINYLLDQWLRVFPRNPIARGVGVLAVCAMLAFVVFYQVRVYFVAWPHHKATQQTFRLPQP